MIVSFVENYKKSIQNKNYLDRQMDVLRMLQQSKKDASYFTSFAAAYFITW